jgi:hypothetical protein
LILLISALAYAVKEGFKVFWQVKPSFLVNQEAAIQGVFGIGQCLIKGLPLREARGIVYHGHDIASLFLRHQLIGDGIFEDANRIRR